MKVLLLCQDVNFGAKLVQRRNLMDAEYCNFDTVYKLSEDDKCLNGMFVAEADLAALKPVKKGPHKGWVRIEVENINVCPDDDKEIDNYFKILSLNSKGKPELLMGLDSSLSTSCVVMRRLGEKFLVLPVSPVKLKGLLNGTSKTVVLDSLDGAIKGGFTYEETNRKVERVEDEEIPEENC